MIELKSVSAWFGNELKSVGVPGCVGSMRSFACRCKAGASGGHESQEKVKGRSSQLGL